VAQGEAAPKNATSQCDLCGPDVFGCDVIGPDVFGHDVFRLDVFGPDVFEPDVLEIGAADYENALIIRNPKFAFANPTTLEKYACRAFKAKGDRHALFEDAGPTMLRVKCETAPTTSPTFNATRGFKKQYGQPLERTLINPRTAAEYRANEDEGWRMVLKNDPNLSAPPLAGMELNSERWSTLSDEVRSVKVEGRMLEAYDAILESMLKRGGTPEAWEEVATGPKQPWYATTIHSMRRSVRGMGKKVHDLQVGAAQVCLHEAYGKGKYIAMAHPEGQDIYYPALGSHAIFTCLEEDKMTSMHHDDILGLSGVGNRAVEEAAAQLPTFHYPCRINLHAEAESLLKAAMGGEESINEAVVSTSRRLDSAYSQATAPRDAAPKNTASKQINSFSPFTPRDHLEGRREVSRQRGKKSWRVVSFVDVLESWAVEAKSRSRINGSLFISEIVYDRFTIRESELWMALLGQLAEAKGIMLNREHMDEVLSRILHSSRDCYVCRVSSEAVSLVCTNDEHHGCPNAVHLASVKHGPSPSISNESGEPWFHRACINIERFFPPTNSCRMPLHAKACDWKCPSSMFRTLVDLMQKNAKFSH
jgi:hypothetical protein